MTEADFAKMLLPALGPTAGCVVIVWLFVRFLSNFLSNHLSAQAKALSDVCASLAGLKAVIDECHLRRP